MQSIEQLNYIKAPAATVYKALTTRDGLGKVWTKKLSVEPKVGYVNEFDFDEGYTTKMKITDLSENQKVVWECLESDREWVGTGISFELFEKDGVTTVTLDHFGWRKRTEYYRWCSYNWAMFLFSLKTYCEEEKGLPYQERDF